MITQGPGGPHKTHDRPAKLFWRVFFPMAHPETKETHPMARCQITSFGRPQTVGELARQIELHLLDCFDCVIDRKSLSEDDNSYLLTMALSEQINVAINIMDIDIMGCAQGA
jgi:hypothetical protein